MNISEKTPIQILFDNYKCKEGTFIYFLHEDALFNDQAFWAYYNNMISVIKDRIDDKLDENITLAVVFTYQAIVEAFLWHSTPNDAYVIKDYPSDKISFYMERLDALLGGYLKGYIIDEEKFGDDLINPIKRSKEESK